MTEQVTGARAVVGAKSGFCIADAERWEEGSGASCEIYECLYQGISRGCADNYGAVLPCQWVDITGVAPGGYELSVTINADRTVPEASYSNNVVTVRLQIDARGVSIAR